MNSTSISDMNHDELMAYIRGVEFTRGLKVNTVKNFITYSRRFKVGHYSQMLVEYDGRKALITKFPENKRWDIVYGYAGEIKLSGDRDDATTRDDALLAVGHKLGIARGY